MSSKLCEFILIGEPPYHNHDGDDDDDWTLVQKIIAVIDIKIKTSAASSHSSSFSLPKALKSPL